jgi:hypothetical protein
MAILGIVTLAISNLYISNLRNTSTTEEVSDVQQNTRAALDLMARDIRNSGFLLPTSQPAVSAAPYFLCRDTNSDGDCADSGESSGYTLQTAAPTGKVARIATGFLSVADTTQGHVIAVSSADMVDLFQTGDFVRIFRPGTSAPVQDLIYRVTNMNRNATPPSLTLVGFGEVDSFLAGDIIAGIPVLNASSYTFGFPPPTDGPSVSTITYTLVDDPGSSDPNMRQLNREVLNSGGPQVVAGQIRDVEISYRMKDGTVRSLGSGSAPTGDERLDIAAVRLVITGATDATKTGQAGFSGGVKSRSIETTIKIRNL